MDMTGLPINRPTYPEGYGGIRTTQAHKRSNSNYRVTMYFCLVGKVGFSPTYVLYER